MNIFDPHISGSLSVSGSGEISGDLTVLGTINATISGTTSNALTTSEAPKYTLTSSFGDFTSSYTTGSFTGSFIGDGGGLTNIPASGVTGLNLSQISTGSISASLSLEGFNINTDTSITGTLIVSGLRYPTVDNGEKSFIQTDGNGVLSLQYVDTLIEPIRNGESTTLIKGTPVYISGSLGANPVVFAADAGNPTKMPVIYIVKENISTNEVGEGILLGRIEGVNTTGYAPGTEIFVGVGGGWTSTRPTGTAIIQSLGVVTKEGTGGQGIVLNPGPANLPNLPTNELFIGDTNSHPVSKTIVEIGLATTSSLNSLSSSIATTDLNQTNRLISLEGVSGSYATTGSNIFIGTQTHSGSIIPSVDNEYDLGSVTHQWRDVYISSGSLYIDGTKVLSSTAQELIITTDSGQSIKILEGGTDSIILQSADGNIELKSNADGDILLDPTNGKILLKGTVEVLNGNKIQSSVGGTPVVFANDIVVSGSIVLTGTIDGIDLIAFSSSVNTRIGTLEISTSSLNAFTSSATTRLNSLETTTGSLNSYTSSNNTRLGVIETTTGSLNSYTSSNNSRLTTIESTTSSLNSYTSSNNTINTTQNNRLSSLETSTGSLNSYTSSNDIRLGMIETSTSSLNSFTSSINTTIKNRLNSEGIISGSSQINITGTTGYSTFSSSIATTDLNQTNRLISLEGKSGSYATTGSNVFIGDQTITGSLFVSQNLIVQGSSSLENITASAVSIGTNTIVLNTDSPAFRYAGISVFDSGSTNVTASLFYDSLTNQWKFKHVDVDSNDASIVLFGPLGSDIDNAPLLTSNYLTKVEGGNNHGHHITTSSIFDDGSKVSINSNTEITGTLKVTGTPIVSGSGQVSFNGITDKPTLVSGSAQVSFNGITDKPTLVSGSSQITYGGLTGIPSGIISGAAQLPNGVVSGSSQVLSGTGIFSSSVQLPSGLVSGSSQVLAGTTIHSGSFFNGITVVSGSAQISFNGITDKPTLVSGSSQVSFNGIVDKPTLVSGSSQISYPSLSNIPGGIVSGSSQIDLTATTNYSSGIKTRLNAEGVISGSSQVTLTSTQVTNGLGYTPYNNTNPNGYISSYTETSTLANVVSRGNTANNKIIINSTGIGGDATLKINTSTSSTFVHSQENLAPNLTAGQHNISVIGRTANTKNSGYIGYYWAGDASNSNFVTIGHWGNDDLFRIYGNGVVSVGTNAVWHTGNLTNLNQLTNGPGYITSYTETDTLATVTGRGASTSTAISINNTLTVTSGRVIARTGGVNTYGIFSGYDNNNHMVAFRSAISGPTASPTFTAGHQTTFIEYAEANDTTGWFFKSSSSTNYEEIARITRTGINWNGNTVYHAGNFTNNSSNWNTAFGWGNHASAGYASASLSNNKTYTSTGNAVGSFLGGHYSSGGTEKPNSGTFGAGKFKVAMLSGGNLGFGGSWNDVMWVSTYNGGDVKSSHALVFDKYSSNVWVSDQNFDSASWGTGHLLLHSSNYTSYAMAGAGYSANQNLNTNNSVQFASLGVGVSPALTLHIRGSGEMVRFETTSTASNGYTQLNFKAGSRNGYIWLGNENTSSWAGAGGLNIYTENGNIDLWSNAVQRIRLQTDGHLVPYVNGTYNLGSSSLRWNTVFTSDLSLSNGIGDYTIVEGENDLFLYNNKQNKVYKFMLQEVNPNDATPKRPE